MSKASDELRKVADTYDDKAFLPKLNGMYHDLADRIDAEMVELPRDADGKPIHVGETMYGLRGRGRMVVSLRLYGEEDPTWMVSMGTDACVHPSRITHERPDSLERIADELDEIKERFRTSDSDTFFALQDLAGRVRAQVKEREHE